MFNCLAMRLILICYKMPPEKKLPKANSDFTPAQVILKQNILDLIPVKIKLKPSKS